MACRIFGVSPTKADFYRMETCCALLAHVRGIHPSPVNSLHKGHWRGALMYSLICARINSWINNREAGDLRRHRAHYDVYQEEMLYTFQRKCTHLQWEQYIWRRHLQKGHLFLFQHVIRATFCRITWLFLSRCKWSTFAYGYFHMHR